MKKKNLEQFYLFFLEMQAFFLKFFSQEILAQLKASACCSAGLGKRDSFSMT
jgi:hypothetical protein